MRDRNAPLTAADIAGLDWAKSDRLIPAVVQDAATAQVLMLGYMNAEALAVTLESGFVTFFSRSKGRLWRKGETSGDTLSLVAIHADCDNDALLVFSVGGGNREMNVSETADLIYHLTVLMEAREFGWDDVAVVLAERHKA